MNCTLIQNGLVYDFNKYTLIKKDILIECGKIKITSEKSINVDAKYKVIDANEKYIIPGLIDCHTHIGIMEECTGKLGIDNNEISNPITPHLRGIDGVNPLDIAFGEDPLSTYGTNKKCSVTRMAVTALIRELFMKAEDYMNQK